MHHAAWLTEINIDIMMNFGLIILFIAMLWIYWIKTHGNLTKISALQIERQTNYIRFILIFWSCRHVNFARAKFTINKNNNDHTIFDYMSSIIENIHKISSTQIVKTYILEGFNVKYILYMNVISKLSSKRY